MLSKKIGIDLGTSTVLVYVKGEGIVVNEPALMATDERGARVLAVGRAASELLGRGGKARAVRPVRDGDGVDYDAAGAMVRHLLDDRGWARVTVDPYTWNEQALRAWRKAGFVPVSHHDPDEEHTAPWVLMEVGRKPDGA